MAWQALGAVRQRLLLEAVQPQAGRVERACSPGVVCKGPTRVVTLVRLALRCWRGSDILRTDIADALTGWLMSRHKRSIIREFMSRPEASRSRQPARLSWCWPLRRILLLFVTQSKSLPHRRQAYAVLPSGSFG